MRRSSSLATWLWVISIFSRSHNTSQQMTGNSVQLDYATCKHDAHKNHHGNSVFSRRYASFELQIQPMVRTNYIVIYYDFNPTSRGSGQAKPKPSRHWRLWPGLKILKAEAAESQAKAVAFRPSWAGTSLPVHRSPYRAHWTVREDHHRAPSIQQQQKPAEPPSFDGYSCWEGQSCVLHQQAGELWRDCQDCHRPWVIWRGTDDLQEVRSTRDGYQCPRRAYSVYWSWIWLRQQSQQAWSLESTC